MSKKSHSVVDATIAGFAFLFLLAGAGVGVALGLGVGAASDGNSRALTITPATTEGKAFNWLLFEIGLCSGLVACAVLLAASFRTATGADL